MLATHLTARLEDLCLLAAHNFLFSILTDTQYLEAICIHKLKMCQTMLKDRLMDVVTVWFEFLLSSFWIVLGWSYTLCGLVCWYFVCEWCCSEIWIFCVCGSVYRLYGCVCVMYIAQFMYMELWFMWIPYLHTVEQQSYKIMECQECWTGEIVEVRHCLMLYGPDMPTYW